MPKALDVHWLVLKVTLGFVVILFLIGLVLPGHYRGNAGRRAETHAMMEAVLSAVTAYESDNGHPPIVQNNSDLVKLLQGDNPRKLSYVDFKPSQLNAQGELLDGWGTPMRISYEAKKELILQSAGPDRQWGTADDLSSE